MHFKGPARPQDEEESRADEARQTVPTGRSARFRPQSQKAAPPRRRRGRGIAAGDRDCGQTRRRASGNAGQVPAGQRVSQASPADDPFGEAVDATDTDGGLRLRPRLPDFAAHDYLSRKKGIPTHLTGIDHDPEIVETCRAIRDDLQLSGVDFRICEIAEYVPEAGPDIVLSLHACDTATDEAIALGVRRGSRIILAAPCCQHELRAQLDSDVFRSGATPRRPEATHRGYSDGCVSCAGVADYGIPDRRGGIRGPRAYGKEPDDPCSEDRTSRQRRGGCGFVSEAQDVLGRLSQHRAGARQALPANDRGWLRCSRHGETAGSTTSRSIITKEEEGRGWHNYGQQVR